MTCKPNLPSTIGQPVQGTARSEPSGGWSKSKVDVGGGDSVDVDVYCVRLKESCEDDGVVVDGGGRIEACPGSSFVVVDLGKKVGVRVF
jgi:hypothetical protein